MYNDCKQTSTKETGMSKEAKQLINDELANDGLRLAESHEAGWYAITREGKVWATDIDG